MRTSITITKVDKGFWIEAGCKQIGVDIPIDELLEEVKGYLLDPRTSERKHFPSELNDCNVEEEYTCDERASIPQPAPVYRR